MTREALAFEYHLTPKPWVLGKSPVFGFPHVHQSIIFSQLLLDVLKRSRFNVLALELPRGLENLFSESLRYYPLPTILYQKDFLRETKNGKFVPERFFLLTPGDAITEALVFTEQKDVRTYFVDEYRGYQENTMRFLDPILVASVGLNKYVKRHEWVRNLSDEVSRRRERVMSLRLKALAEETSMDVLWVGGLSHWAFIEHDLETRTAKWEKNEESRVGESPDWEARVLHPASLPYLLYEIPYFIALYVMKREDFSYPDALYILLKEAIEPYQEKFDETVSTMDIRKMLQFMRNLALADGRVFPSLFNIIESAKAMVNDDYALEVYRLAVSFPFYPKDLGKLPIIEFGHDLDPSAALSLTLKQRRPQPVIFKGEKSRSVWDLIRAPPGEKYPGEWEEMWNASDGAYSYPPEDVFLEEFMNHIRRKFQRVLAEERASSEVFRTSMKDGIDWRLTTRHIHEGKIYVKEYPKQVGFIDTIVMQFVENDIPYEYSMLWYAEHAYESNLSFISTPPDELIIGPGIARAKFAGFISVYPPEKRMYYIPRGYTEFSTRLIQAAIHCALSNIIGFVGPRPPSLQAREYARKHGFRVLYMPLSTFSRDSVKRLRVFHVLRSPYLREVARKYIGY